MLETAIMIAGICMGYVFLKCRQKVQKKIRYVNDKLQLICVALIIFVMGINLGSMENFVAKMLNMGIKSLIFAIVPTFLSIIIVYFFSRKYIIKN